MAQVVPAVTLSADARSGTDTLTICVTSGGCTHTGEYRFTPDREPTPPMVALYCAAHDYAHKVGVLCRICGSQFWGWKCPE